MNIENSNKIQGYRRFNLAGIVIHAWHPDAGESYITSYWDALDIELGFRSIGLSLLTIEYAAKLIQAGLVLSTEVGSICVGPPWLICWAKDYAAIETNPDTHDFFIRKHASGLGQSAPVWFVET